MQLLEHEAKALLARAGVAVPRGGLWPDVPADLCYPVAVKAQVRSDARGLHGGIRKARTPEEAGQAARQLQTFTLNGLPVDAIRVEEWVQVEAECYLAAVADRSLAQPVLLVTPDGGVQVERGSPPLRLPVDPWIGPLAHHGRRVAALLTVPDEEARRAVSAVWQVFTAADALVVEINPLGRLDSRLIALDARVIVDGSARFRHPDWHAVDPMLTDFEAACMSLGAAATEMDGAVAILTSGAGLGMASVDLVRALGGSVRAFVDLGPAVFRGPAEIAMVVRRLVGLTPTVLLANFFMQLVPADRVAEGIALGLAGSAVPAVVRLRGVRAEEGVQLLRNAGCTVTDDLLEACRLAVAAATDGDSRR